MSQLPKSLYGQTGLVQARMGFCTWFLNCQLDSTARSMWSTDLFQGLISEPTAGPIVCNNHYCTHECIYVEDLFWHVIDLQQINPRVHVSIHKLILLIHYICNVITIQCHVIMIQNLVIPVEPTSCRQEWDSRFCTWFLN